MYQNLITIDLREFSNRFKKELTKVEEEEIAQAFQNELQAQRKAQATQAQGQIQNQSLFNQEELTPSPIPKKSFDEIMDKRLKNQK